VKILIDVSAINAQIVVDGEDVLQYFAARS
jgi:hypothetical protein